MINIIKKYISSQEVNIIDIKNQCGLEIKLTSIGAGIFEVILDGKMISYQNEKIEDYLYSDAYFGKCVGRTCGRIAHGIAYLHNEPFKVSLPKGNVHQLHGGKGISFTNFNVETKDNEDNYEVIFTLLSKDGEDGFPGNVNLKFTYIIYKKSNLFKLRLEADTDKDTIINLTNHAYWNLNGKGTILNHALKVKASKYADIDDEGIFIKEVPVDEVMDFRKDKLISKDIFNQELNKMGTTGYDHDWILDNKNKPCCVLTSDNQDVKLGISTTYPVCHVYTGNMLPNIYSGCAIELEKKSYDFSSITLEKNQHYLEETSYNIIKGE